MKTSFSSNDQLCHIFAQQTQSTGKTPNMFFEGDTIYSYGTHYTAAKIYTIKGQRVALVNSHVYSNTTAKHLSSIRSSLTSLMPYFSVPDVNNFRSIENYNHLNDTIIEHISSLLCRKKFWSTPDVMIETLLESVADVNVYFKLAGYKPIVLETLLIESISTYLKKVEAKNALKIEAEKAKHKLELENIKPVFNNHVTNWISTGDRESLSFINQHSDLLVNDIFRINGSEIVTQRGARVTLSEARALMIKLEQGQNVIGETVGDFTVEGVTADSIKIGCHCFSLTEVRRLLSGPSLRLA